MEIALMLSLLFLVIGFIFVDNWKLIIPITVFSISLLFIQQVQRS